MTELPDAIESVCPECLATIPGRFIRIADKVVMDKNCPVHGRFTATVWQGQPAFETWVRPKIPYAGGERHAAGTGCPRDCGLCANHSQRTCTALVEVTSRCNLRCPVCFADSGGNALDPSLDMLKNTLRLLMARTGGCNLQLSGGEPTVRPDLPEIVAMARDIGFTFIQLNTNGLRLAEEPGFALQLRDAGLSSVFLQFDGVTDTPYISLRGRGLFAVKCQAIDNLAAARLGIVLVPTLMRGVNTDQVWQIVRFGLSRQPHVRGVHFQPISYFGRFPEHFSPDHVTLPEIMQNLAHYSQGGVQIADFHPPGCEHSLCSFSARYLTREDGSLQLLGGKNACDCTPKPAEEGALISIGATARQWNRVLPMAAGATDACDDELSRFLQRARTHTFQISAMAFQDCWNLNLERLQGCCIHVAREDGRLIPFCSFNLTSRSGTSLHRKPKIMVDRSVATTPVDKLVARRLSLQDNWGRQHLEEAQMAALRRTVRHALSGSSLYRERLTGLDPESLRTMQDLHRLPLLTSEDITRYGHRLLAVSQSRVARVVTLQTSGSTGPPKRLMFTTEDLAATLDFFVYGMQSLIDADDRVLVLLPFTQPDSVGHLLLQALTGSGIEAFGMWPPQPHIAQYIIDHRLTSGVGLPQHLLALAETIGPGHLRSMLLCSDYAAPALRARIEKACDCRTFLHYGTTESGLGGGVECGLHTGCHIRESELLVEIVDPLTGAPLTDGQLGEVVITTLGREAMPLLRYRTGDLARLTREPCGCGGITARLYDIRGRQTACRLPGGDLYSQDLDDVLFQLQGLLDYRATLDRQETERLNISFLAAPPADRIENGIVNHLLTIPVVAESLASGELSIGHIQQVERFPATHTVKRTLLDLRNTGELYATRA